MAAVKDTLLAIPLFLLKELPVDKQRMINLEDPTELTSK